MENIMVVKVKYGYQGMALSSDRFTYEDEEGRKHRDAIRLSFDYGGPISKLEQASAELIKRGYNVIGTDGWGQKEGYIVISANGGIFKSLSGKHELYAEKLMNGDR